MNSNEDKWANLDDGIAAANRVVFSASDSLSAASRVVNPVADSFRISNPVSAYIHDSPIDPSRLTLTHDYANASVVLNPGASGPLIQSDHVALTHDYANASVVLNPVADSFRISNPVSAYLHDSPIDPNRLTLTHDYADASVVLNPVASGPLIQSDHVALTHDYVTGRGSLALNNSLIHGPTLGASHILSAPDYLADPGLSLTGLIETISRPTGDLLNIGAGSDHPTFFGAREDGITVQIRHPAAMDSELWGALGDLGASFQDMLEGAWTTFTARGADSRRQAAHSARELVDWVLRTLAPDSAFDPEDLAQAEINKPTRRMRLEHILGPDMGGKTLRRVDRQLESTHGQLDAVAHTGSGSTAYVRGLLRSAEGILLIVFGRRRRLR